MQSTFAGMIAQVPQNEYRLLKSNARLLERTMTSICLLEVIKIYAVS